MVYIDGVLELRTQKRGATTKQGLELHVLDGQKRLGRRRSGDSFDSKPDNLLVLGDHLGSANVELDWSLGSFVDREEFRPYGETSFGSYANKRYRFTGKERDEESGLNYHGARYYAPGLARWMSPDPKGLVDGVNLYGYVRSNPLNRIDPMGTESLPIGRVKSSQNMANMSSGMNFRNLLDGKLSVVPDDFIGSKAGHQVSIQEFERRLGILTKIAQGKSSYLIDTEQVSQTVSNSDFAGTPYQRGKAITAIQYYGLFLEDVARLLQTFPGTQLLAQMTGKNRGCVTILHLPTTNGILDPSRISTNSLSKSVIDYFMSNKPSSAILSYAPGITIPGRGWQQSRSDVILLHESNHAIGFMNKTLPNYVIKDNQRVPGDRIQSVAYPGKLAGHIEGFEYQASGIGMYSDHPTSENHYRSARNMLFRTSFGLHDDNMELRPQYLAPDTADKEANYEKSLQIFRNQYR